METSLLAKLASGDNDAMKAFIDRYGDLLWSLARRFFSNPAELEDAVQEAVIDVWRNAGRYDPAVASEATFITMIARRRLIDRLRRQKRRPVPEPLPNPDMQPSRDLGTDLEDMPDVARAVAVIEGLRSEQRNVVELSVFRGYSHSDIARLLNMPLGTVKTHLRRALIEVREQIERGDSASSGTA